MPLTQEQHARLLEIRAIRRRRKRLRLIRRSLGVALALLLIAVGLYMHFHKTLPPAGKETPGGCIVAPDGKTVLC